MFSELTKALRKMNGGKSRTMAAYLGEAEDEFDESKHPRGNPKNAGQFAKKGSGRAHDCPIVEGLSKSELVNNERARVRAQQVLDEIGGTVFGSAMAKDFKDQGKVSLIGRSVSGADDIAALCSVYRNPSFETFRWFFVKDGKIAYQTGVTSRLPGHTTAVCRGLTQELATNVASLGGIDGFYCLHNHPTGNVNPSNADKVLTAQIASRMTGYIGAKFLGHVVIDHNKYSVIDENGDATVGIPMQSSGKRFEDMEKELDSPLLGADVSSTGKLALFAARMQAVSEQGGDAQIVATGGVGFEVRGIASCPLENIVNKSVERIGDIMRRYAIASSSGACSLAVDEAKMTPGLIEKLKECISKRVFTDVVCMRNGKKVYGVRAKYDIHPGAYEFAQPIGRGGHLTDEIIRPE